jgi:hypothetical protein
MFLPSYLSNICTAKQLLNFSAFSLCFDCELYIDVSTRCCDGHIGLPQTSITLPTYFSRFSWPSVLLVWVNLKGSSFEDVPIEQSLNITTAALRDDWTVLCMIVCVCVCSPSEPITGYSRCAVLWKVPRVDYRQCRCQQWDVLSVLCDMYTPVAGCAVLNIVKWVFV